MRAVYSPDQLQESVDDGASCVKRRLPMDLRSLSWSPQWPGERRLNVQRKVQHLELGREDGHVGAFILFAAFLVS